MADRPIIFSAPMIQALLAGRKTQTRRLLKPQPPEWATFCQQPTMLNVLHQWVPSGLWRWSEPEQTPPRALRQWPVDAEGSHYWLRPPYAKRDRLYVREAWAPLDALTHNDPGTTAVINRGFYRADDSTVAGEISRWRPSIHMPRWASRLTLIVTDVQVERLQDISEADAAAEGLIRLRSGRYALHKGEQYAGLAQHTARARFADLWASIHGPEAWAANPWVVAVTFSVHRANIDALPANALDIAGAA